MSAHLLPISACFSMMMRFCGGRGGRTGFTRAGECAAGACVGAGRDWPRGWRALQQSHGQFDPAGTVTGGRTSSSVKGSLLTRGSSWLNLGGGEGQQVRGTRRAQLAAAAPFSCPQLEAPGGRRAGAAGGAARSRPTAERARTAGPDRGRGTGAASGAGPGGRGAPAQAAALAVAAAAQGGRDDGPVLGAVAVHQLQQARVLLCGSRGGALRRAGGGCVAGGGGTAGAGARRRRPIGCGGRAVLPPPNRRGRAGAPGDHVARLLLGKLTPMSRVLSLASSSWAPYARILAREPRRGRRLAGRKRAPGGPLPAVRQPGTRGTRRGRQKDYAPGATTAGVPGGRARGPGVARNGLAGRAQS
jgi:hypothetical protein